MVMGSNWNLIIPQSWLSWWFSPWWSKERAFRIFLNSPWEAPGDGEKELDLIKWWGYVYFVSWDLHLLNYTIVSFKVVPNTVNDLHRNYLAIQGSSVASERSFSSSGITDTLALKLYGSIPVWESADPQNMPTNLTWLMHMLMVILMKY